MKTAVNKKSSLYIGHPDAELLSRLSKAALLDLLVETLRLNAGHCDTPCTHAELADLCNVTLGHRGDRLL